MHACMSMCACRVLHTVAQLALLSNSKPTRRPRPSLSVNGALPVLAAGKGGGQKAAANLLFGERRLALHGARGSRRVREPELPEPALSSSQEEKRGKLPARTTGRLKKSHLRSHLRSHLFHRNACRLSGQPRSQVRCCCLNSPPSRKGVTVSTFLTITEPFIVRRGLGLTIQKWSVQMLATVVLTASWQDCTWLHVAVLGR